MICADDFSHSFATELNKVCEHSPYGARIAAYYSAYRGKQYNFLDTWLCRENGRAVCALSRYYNTVVICGKCSEEIRGFIEMLSPKIIFADAALEIKPKNMIEVSGETMICTHMITDIPILPEGLRCKRLTGEMRQLRKVYDLLREHYYSAGESSMLSLGEFDEYFVDISHLIRHGAADVYAVYDGDRIVSSLSVTARSDTAAVIGNIVTHTQYRRNGLAEYLLAAAVNEICKSGREVFLHREKKISIYEKMKFEVTGNWVIGRAFDGDQIYAFQ